MKIQSDLPKIALIIACSCLVINVCILTYRVTRPKKPRVEIYVNHKLVEQIW
jgi:hypothetical protein